MVGRSVGVAVRHAALEAARAPWTWAIVPAILGLALVVLGLPAKGAGDPRAWSVAIGSAEVAAFILAVWVSSGIFSAEVSSGRLDLLLSAGMSPRAWALAVETCWLVFLVVGTWTVAGAVLLFLRPGSIPASVVLAIAAAPLNGMVLAGIGFVLGAVLPRRTNALALVLLTLVVNLAGAGLDPAGWGGRALSLLHEVLAPARGLHAAAGPGGVIFYDSASLRVLAALAETGALAWLAAVFLSRPRLRRRLG